MKKKLLLADDSITIQKVVGIIFAAEDDYQLLVTEDGDSAYQKALEEIPDLVIADMSMPGRDGFELCRAIKNETSLAGTSVLLLPGAFEHFDEARAQEVCADGWLTKPFESQALLDKVAQLLAAEPNRPAGLEETDAAASVAAEESLTGGDSVDPALGVDETVLGLEDVEELAEPAAAEPESSPEDIWDAVSFAEDDLQTEAADLPEEDEDAFAAAVLTENDTTQPEDEPVAEEIVDAAGDAGASEGQKNRPDGTSRAGDSAWDPEPADMSEMPAADPEPVDFASLRESAATEDSADDTAFGNTDGIFSGGNKFAEEDAPEAFEAPTESPDESETDFVTTAAAEPGAAYDQPDAVEEDAAVEDSFAADDEVMDLADDELLEALTGDEEDEEGDATTVEEIVDLDETDIIADEDQDEQFVSEWLSDSEAAPVEPQSLGEAPVTDSAFSEQLAADPEEAGADRQEMGERPAEEAPGVFADVPAQDVSDEVLEELADEAVEDFPEQDDMPESAPVDEEPEESGFSGAEPLAVTSEEELAEAETGPEATDDSAHGAPDEEFYFDEPDDAPGEHAREEDEDEAAEAVIMTAGTQAYTESSGVSPEQVEEQLRALSDEELEAVVKRVAGPIVERMAGSILEQVAWDVVPDLAESLIREEIRKIKQGSA